MQVKKFEARSMKEALEMVKKELGPDAIILGVRDNKKSYGLVGDVSIEITAAVSEETLKRKKFAESRMRDEDKFRLTNSPAKAQREYINKVVDNYLRAQEKEAPKMVTRTPYIEIADEVDGMTRQSGNENDRNYSQPASQSARSNSINYANMGNQVEATPQSNAATPASERIRGAAQRAWTAMQVHGEWLEQKPAPKPAPAMMAPKSTTGAGAVAVENQLLSAMQMEIASLKQVIKNFQTVPQQMQAPMVAHPGADFGLGFDVSFMFEKLTQAGVSPEIAAEILTTAQTNMPQMRLKNKALVDAWVAKYILDTTKVAEKSHARVQVFAGPAGAGKTSMLVKHASHAVVNDKKKVAILTTDTLKVGAVEQLRIYAQILNIPFAIIRQNSDWHTLSGQLSQFDQIFVDTPGLSLKNLEETSFLRNVLPPSDMPATMHLVLESTAKDSDITELGKRYKSFNPADVIFTNLENSVQHGTIYNFMKRFEMPLHSFGLGTRVPEDFEMATKERVLDLIFKLTSLKRAN